MNPRHLLWASALLAASTATLPAWAQASAPAPAASVGAAPQRPVGPRLLTPAEKRSAAEEATSTDIRPERPVVPQISIPFGKTPPPPASAPRMPPKAAPTLGVSDGAARCNAQPSDEERAACRKEQARVAKLP